MAVKPIPEGYHNVTPYLIVDGAADAIRWYGQALGATELMRLPMPVLSGVEGGDKIGHAEIKLGDSVIMLSDEWPDYGKLSPAKRGGATAGLMVYVEDADAAFDQAVAAGATVEQPVTDQCYGDRSGSFTDPFGHSWTIATHVEDVPEEEMQRRMTAWSQEQAGAQAEAAA